jgi:hypothetical protein
MSLYSGTGTVVPFEDVEKPLLAGPFRFLDRIFTGGRVVRAFQLVIEAPPAAAPRDTPPDTPR